MLPALLCSLLPSLPVQPAPAPSSEGSLLAAVPENAWALAHCRDVAGLRARAERNDWYRLLGSSEGEPLLAELALQFRGLTHTELDDLQHLAAQLPGEVVFFDTVDVAGFVAEPPPDRAALAEPMRAWLPEGGDAAARRTLEVAGGTVELVGWPDSLDGWSGRAGHFVAFVDHPQALALYSGNDAEAVLAALTQGLTTLGTDRRAPVVASYLAAGGGRAGGVELFLDFTPFVAQAEAELAEAGAGALPDPSGLLGLERGTTLHATLDVLPGTRVDCRALLTVPADTLAAELADTFQPLPNTLPVDLPEGVWALWALNWDLKRFYARARAAFEEAGRGEQLAGLDQGVEAARGLSGVDPVDGLLNQLAGDFALYLVHPPQAPAPGERPGEEETLLSLGFQAGLVPGGGFLDALEQLLGVGGFESQLELEEIAGVDAYLFDDDEVDGGFACVPTTFTIAPGRRVLERSLQALTRVEGASLPQGSLVRAAIDECRGACYLTCVEMKPLRAYLLPELEGPLELPPLEAGRPASDPFDTQLIGSARRTPAGFELRLYTH